MRNLTKFHQILRRMTGVAVLLTALSIFTAMAAFAQSDVECSGGAGMSCITFGGKPLEGPTNQLTSFVLQTLRPDIAQMDASALFTTTVDTQPLPANKSCLGVTEKQTNGMLLIKETVYKTDRSDGRYNAVVPAGGEDHGDWPPHLPLINISADQQAAAGECLVTGEVAWRLVYRPNKPGTMTLEMELNPAQLKEYDVMASGGGLGLFVSAIGSTPVTMTVNGETFASLACSDCSAHTAAITNTIGSGVYSPETVEWFGEIAETSSPLVNMYVLPMQKKAGVHNSVTIELDQSAFVNGKPVIALWLGRFDVKGFNVP